jgi:hypothetical protein
MRGILRADRLLLEPAATADPPRLIAISEPTTPERITQLVAFGLPHQEGMDMDRSVRLRLVLAAPVLGAVYYYLLILLIGLTSASPWPSWWVGTFPNRHVAALIWVVGSHTIGVLAAAIPIAVAAVLVLRGQAMLLGIIVGTIATILAVLPSLTPDIWPLVWNSHPVFFITDQIKLLAAVPAAVWIIRKLLAKSGSRTAAPG